MSWILADILNCGSMDIDFLEKELDAFEVTDDIDFRSIITEGGDFNRVMHEVFVTALSKCGIDVYSDIWADKIEIFCNCLDSHLSIHSEDGGFASVYDLDDIKRLKKVVEKEMGVEDEQEN